ncbi:MAG: toll/interleukin-1 receptor domain-containing protein [Atopobiaceae bacterium]|nr:toll/interleukin-1 receptor domain-containing protein [Atopobiaceae bacterium]
MSTQATNERKYTAFISYRHTQPDMKVAIEVHRKLEHYHLDREVREQSGFDSLAPIFRDQDELPISSALDDDLLRALHNASALIVICSPRLKESKWCMREIDEFLRTHDRSRVFVVICEGEPHDVIPDQLLHRVDADGQVIDVEPLAANFLPTCKGADRRNEVTRLAAGILGVPFDSLVKRAQRRRQRIIVTLASIAVAGATAFGLYNAYMHKQIQDNYTQVLYRRAEYLATLANTMLQQGNTIGATELALAALPSDEMTNTKNHPVVDEAVFALQQATNAGYSGKLVDQFSYTTSEVYTAPADIRQMHVSANEAYVVMVDETEVISAWETATHRLIYQSRSTLGRYKDVIDAFVLDSGNTIIVYTTGVVCRDNADGSVLWDVAITADDKQFKYACIDEGNQDRLLVASAKSAHMIDLSSGKTLYDIAYDGVEGMPTLDGLQTELVNAPRARYGRFCLVVSLVNDEGLFVGGRAVVIEAADGTAHAYETPGYYAYDYDLLEDGSVVMLMGTNSAAQTTSSRDEIFGNVYTTTTDFDVLMACLDGQSGKLRWSKSTTIWQVCYDIGFKELRDNGKVTDTLVCWFADRIQFVDVHTGELVNELKTSSTIVGGNALERGRTFMGVESDGSFFFVSPTSESVIAYGLMRDEFYYADVRPSAEHYILKGNVLYAYRGTYPDKNVHSLEVGARHASWEFATSEGFVLAYLAEDEDVLRVQHCSAPDLEVLWTQDFGAESGLVWNVIGFDGSDDTLVLVGMSGTDNGHRVSELVRLDLPARKAERWDVGTSEELGLAAPAEGSAPSEVEGLVVGNSQCCCAGKVYSQVVDAKGTVCIAEALPSEGRTRCYAIAKGFGKDSDANQRSLYLMSDPTGKRMLYQDYVSEQEGDSGLAVHRSAVLDLATGESTVLDTNVASIWPNYLLKGAAGGHATWSADGKVLGCVSANGVTLYRFDGKASVIAPVDGRRVAGTCISGDRLVVMLTLGTTSQLESFNVKTGEHVSSSALDDGSDEATRWANIPAELTVDGSGDLFVATSNFGYLMSMESLGVCQRFSKGLVYNPTCDAILCADPEGSSYDAFSRYSLAALIERGHTTLNGQTMGKEWLEAHGV